MTRRAGIVVLVLVTLFWLAALAGLPEALGAHPWWAVRTGIVGTLVGAAAAVGLSFAGLSGSWLRWLAGAGLVAAVAAAAFGKRAFVASMAEGALAGRFWYIGWFAVFACLFVVVFLFLRDRVGR